MGQELYPVDELEAFFGLVASDDPEVPLEEARPLTEAVAREPRPMPTVSFSSAEYSSTLAMLRRTREEVSAFSEACRALSCAAELPCSESLRCTVSAIFADPKGAEEISNAALERREDEYRREKLRVVEEQAEQLSRDKVLLAEELEMLAARE